MSPRLQSLAHNRRHRLVAAYCTCAYNLCMSASLAPPLATCVKQARCKHVLRSSLHCVTFHRPRCKLLDNIIVFLELSWSTVWVLWRTWLYDVDFSAHDIIRRQRCRAHVSSLSVDWNSTEQASSTCAAEILLGTRFPWVFRGRFCDGFYLWIYHFPFAIHGGLLCTLLYVIQAA